MKRARNNNGTESPDYPHVSFVVLMMFSFYVIVKYLQVGSRISMLGAIRIELVVACLLIPIALSVSSKNQLKTSTPLKPLAFIYIFLLFVMTILSYDFQISWEIFIERALKFAVLAFFISSFVKSPKGLAFFIIAFMLACFKMGQEGLIGQLTGNMVWENQGVMRLHGSTGLYAHPNSFAGMALGTIPFIMYFFPISNRWVKMILLVQLAFAINIIIFTGSRTGWVGFIGLCVVYFMRSKNKLKILVLLVATLFLAINYVPEEYQNRFQTIYTESEESDIKSMRGGEGSKEARTQILKDAISIFTSNPLGVGVAAFPAIREATFGSFQDTHNLYLEIATNLGIQGLIICFFLIFHMLKHLSQNRKILHEDLSSLKDTLANKNLSLFHQEIKLHSKEIQFVAAVCDSVILFVCLRLFLGFFGMDLYEIYWWFALGITLATNGITRIAHAKTLHLHKKISTQAAL